MKKSCKTIKLIARIIGIITVAWWLLLGIGYGLSDSEPFTWESAVITALIIITTVGFVIAWKNEKIGGLILIISGLAFSIFALFSAGHNHAFAALISGGPFIMVGVLFLIYWNRYKGNNQASQDSNKSLD